MERALQKGTVHHGYLRHGSRDTCRTGQAQAASAEQLCRFLRVLFSPLSHPARQNHRRGDPYRAQCSLSQRGSRQGQKHPRFEGGIPMAARPRQIDPFRHLYTDLAHVPAQTSHQFHGGGRQVRGQCRQASGRHTGRARTQPTPYRRFRETAGQRLLAGGGIQGRQRGQIPGLRTGAVSPWSA